MDFQLTNFFGELYMIFSLSAMFLKFKKSSFRACDQSICCPYNNLRTGTLVYRIRTQINLKDVMIPN
jgi:hypothetical protein